MNNDAAMAVIDDCRMRLQELGVDDVLIACGSDNTGIAYSFKGGTKSLAYLAMSAWLEIMMDAVSNSVIDSGSPVGGDE